MKAILLKVANALLAFFKWTFSNVKNLLIIALLVAGVVLYFKYDKVRNEYDNVIVRTNDSVMVYKNKVGELYKMNEASITDISNLKRSNSELYAENKKLKDDVLMLSKVNITAKADTITMVDTLYLEKPDLYSSKFAYNNDWYSISGNSKFNTKTMLGTTTIDNMMFTGNINVDLIEKKSELFIIANSDNPYFQINNVNGAVISPEKSKALKKRFNKPWGVMIGVGASTFVHDSKVMIKPSLNLTLGYKFISF